MVHFRKIRKDLNNFGNFELGSLNNKIKALSNGERKYYCFQKHENDYVMAKYTNGKTTHITISPEDSEAFEAVFKIDKDFFKLRKNKNDGKNDFIHEMSRIKRNR